jgi:hypothetical protein
MVLEPTEDENDPTESLRLQLHEAAKASAIAIAEDIFLLHPGSVRTKSPRTRPPTERQGIVET